MECGRRDLLETLRQFFSTLYTSAFGESLGVKARQADYITKFEKKLDENGWSEVPKMVVDLEYRLLMGSMIPEYADFRTEFICNLKDVRNYTHAVRAVQTLHRMVVDDKKKCDLVDGGTPSCPDLEPPCPPRANVLPRPKKPKVSDQRSAPPTGATKAAPPQCVAKATISSSQARSLEREIEVRVQKAGLADRQFTISDVGSGVLCELGPDDDEKERRVEAARTLGTSLMGLVEGIKSMRGYKVVRDFTQVGECVGWVQSLAYWPDGNPKVQYRVHYDDGDQEDLELHVLMGAHQRFCSSEFNDGNPKIRSQGPARVKQEQHSEAHEEQEQGAAEAESNTKGQRPLGPKRHAPGKFSGKKSLYNGGNDVKERSSSAEQEQNERARGGGWEEGDERGRGGAGGVGRGGMDDRLRGVLSRAGVFTPEVKLKLAHHNITTLEGFEKLRGTVEEGIDYLERVRKEAAASSSPAVTPPPSSSSSAPLKRPRGGEDPGGKEGSGMEGGGREGGREEGIDTTWTAAGGEEGGAKDEEEGASEEEGGREEEGGLSIAEAVELEHGLGKECWLAFEEEGRGGEGATEEELLLG